MEKHWHSFYPGGDSKSVCDFLDVLEKFNVKTKQTTSDKRVYFLCTDDQLKKLEKQTDVRW